VLDRQDVLAGAAFAAMTREPRARAAGDAVLEADAVLRVAAANTRALAAVLEPDGALVDELAGSEQARGILSSTARS
jgi:hypothetical protein